MALWCLPLLFGGVSVTHFPVWIGCVAPISSGILGAPFRRCATDLSRSQHFTSPLRISRKSYCGFRSHSVAAGTLVHTKRVIENINPSNKPLFSFKDLWSIRIEGDNLSPQSKSFRMFSNPITRAKVTISQRMGSGRPLAAIPTPIDWVRRDVSKVPVARSIGFGYRKISHRDESPVALVRGASSVCRTEGVPIYTTSGSV